MEKTGKCARETLDPARPKRGRASTVPSVPPVAIYHLHVKNISRKDGRSAVAAAAYRAGETLPNAAEEKDSAFGGKRDVIFTDIRLPAEAPSWMSDRASLWNAAEAAEKRKDARLAKEIEFSLPRELPSLLWVQLAREMADLYVTRGHVVDIAIHDDGSGTNPHVHLMLTTRAVGPDGFKLKMREADGLAFVTQAREGWAHIANAALGKAGADVQIDARSHAARGVDQKPTKHRGPDPAERRARRWGTIMDHDILEARRELLGQAKVRDRFPQLSGRPDWPPERREPVPGLTPGEVTEWKTFWREIDKRVWGAELHPPRAEDEALRIENRGTVQLVTALETVTAAMSRDHGVSEAKLDDILPTWRGLHALMVERMRAEGHRTDHPLDDWGRVEAALRDFDAKLHQLRQPASERDAPVPDPDGRPISPRELEDAQDRMIIATRQPPSRTATTPRPELMPASQRAAAQEAVERQNAMEVPEREADAYSLAPHESRLDWLETTTTQRVPIERESRLDWLRAPVEAEPDNEPDRARDR